MECISVTALLATHSLKLFISDILKRLWNLLVDWWKHAQGCGVYIVHNGAAAHIDLTNTCDDEVGIIIVATFRRKQEL